MQSKRRGMTVIHHSWRRSEASDVLARRCRTPGYPASRSSALCPSPWAFRLAEERLPTSSFSSLARRVRYMYIRFEIGFHRESHFLNGSLIKGNNLPNLNHGHNLPGTKCMRPIVRRQDGVKPHSFVSLRCKSWSVSFFTCPDLPKLVSVHSDLLPDWCAQWAPSAAVQNWHYQRCKVRNHSLIIFSWPRGQEVHQLSSARRPAVQTF